MKLRVIVFCGLLISNCYGMEKNMMAIATEKEIEPFAGSVVAYTTTSLYFGFDQGVCIDNPVVKYGYIDHKNMNRPVRNEYGALIYSLYPDLEKYFRLYQLLRVNVDMSHARCIAPSDIKDGNLHVRHITRDEAGKIFDMVQAKKAKFDYLFDGREPLPQILKILSQRKI